METNRERVHATTQPFENISNFDPFQAAKQPKLNSSIYQPKEEVVIDVEEKEKFECLYMDKKIYEWEETKESIDIYFMIPPDKTDQSDINSLIDKQLWRTLEVKLLPQHLKVGFSGYDPYIDVKLN